MSGAKDDIKRILRVGELVTPKVTSYLLNSNGPDWTSKIMQEQILPLLTTPRVRTQAAFHPSSLAGCPRAQIFSFIGAPSESPHSADLMNIFLNGHFTGLRWATVLLGSGAAHSVEVPVAIPELRFEGSMDGEGATDTFAYGVEIKTVYSLWQARKDRHGIPRPKNVQQCDGYFLARPDIEKFSLLYEDKQFNKWEEYTLTPVASRIKATKKILEDLNRNIDKKELPDVLDECAKGKGKTFTDCQFSQICLGCRSFKQAETLAEGIQIGRGSTKPKRTGGRTVRIRRSAPRP